MWTLLATTLSAIGSSIEKDFDTDTAVKVYYVVQDSVDVDVACQDIECHTLVYYMNHSLRALPRYFKSNESYIFWSGDHTPLDNATVIISNVTNLKLIGNGANINCDGMSVGFLFNRSTDITLRDLNFMSCTRHHFHYAPVPLVFVDGNGLTLYGITLWGSGYGAIFIQDTLGVVDLKELTVVNSNTANHKLPQAISTVFYKQCFGQTPFLRIKDSTFVNNSNLKWGAIPGKYSPIPFAGGLTIRLECPRIDIEINNVTMRNNSGGDGGHLAILFGTNTCGNITIVESYFESGYSLEGSGVYAEFKNVTNLNADRAVCGECQGLLHIVNSSFVDNEVQYAGSGVYIIHRQLGTVCGMKRIKLTNCTFERNSVIKSGFGGIALHSINLVMTNYVLHNVPQFLIEIDNCT